ncbi:hypothetical protein [Bremerella sp. P1]|uniref:hypothetical protein n=1 Tax=Bremerella sp. P1 TaxID=3026424 RepID=UPI002368E781|nr:hypothetical protein [Bremerella sp. P1]WDI43153.1 hypothetical protein PSR63_04235 [Bremerella sp. P1]
MTNPSNESDSPSHLRFNHGSEEPSRQARWLRGIGGIIMGLSLGVAFAPLFFTADVSSAETTTYLLCLVTVLVLDASLVALIITWRSVASSRLGEWQFTVDGFQSSLYRNLLLGGGMHTLSLFLLWIPLLMEKKPDLPLNGFLPFVVMAGFGALASMPWLVQFFLNTKGHDLEVHEEGMMIGGFYPCRWNRILSYTVWDDAASLIAFDIRGRGPVEVFMAPSDRKILVEELRRHVGPPKREGRSDDLPDDDHNGQFGNLTVFR